MSTYDTDIAPRPDRRVKITHLVFGLLFLGLAGVWALAETGVITTDGLPVLAPAVLIAAGVIGLVASLANGRNRRSSTGFGRAAEPSYLTPTASAETDPWPEDDDTTPTEEIR